MVGVLYVGSVPVNRGNELHGCTRYEITAPLFRNTPKAIVHNLFKLVFLPRQSPPEPLFLFLHLPGHRRLVGFRLTLERAPLGVGHVVCKPQYPLNVNICQHPLTLDSSCSCAERPV